MPAVVPHAFDTYRSVDATVLRDKHVQANNTGKNLWSFIVDDMAIKKSIRWNSKEYTGFVTYKDEKNTENNR